jgi:hypothetical protein
MNVLMDGLISTAIMASLIQDLEAAKTHPASPPL